MSTKLRIISLALGTLILASSCTFEEIIQYLEPTQEFREVLSADELARLRHCESTDNYQAISPSGRFRGAYQFDQITWDDVAGRHFVWLVGVDPIDADPWWQDSMTRALWSERGRQPWPHCGLKV
ncbi:MAG: transglycosylase family protein [Acidimicrobiales bacterium]|nr:transglycosylase family protein [Acidimicrobiales bacterium]MDG2218235.1 transglycosylase family protein [Acidimicrobiales bacterium]